jgi:hypothetical protein
LRERAFAGAIGPRFIVYIWYFTTGWTDPAHPVFIVVTRVGKDDDESMTPRDDTKDLFPVSTNTKYQ